MRKTITILLLILSLTAKAANYYISTTGNNANAGSLAAPWATWDKLESVSLSAGDTVFIRGGTYRSTKGNDVSVHVRWNGINGTSGNPVCIWAYPADWAAGSYPVLNMDDIVTSRHTSALEISSCSYMHIKGLRVTGLAQPNSSISLNNIHLHTLTNSILENCRADHSGMYGFAFGSGCNTISVKNCDVDHLMDISEGGANGFNITGGSTATNIFFEGCRAWYTSDDGWDFYRTNAYVTFDNCWAFWNGYKEGFVECATGDGVGFKVGPVVTTQTTARIIMRNCLAIHNKEWGFNQNSQPTETTIFNPVILYNNTSYDNGNYGYAFSWGPSGGTPSIFRNNISYMDGNTFTGEAVDVNDHNTWNGGVLVNSADFVTLDTTGISGPRKPDGSLPDLNLLRLVESSDLVDRGIFIGLPFVGQAPDIGAYEYEAKGAPDPDPDPEVVVIAVDANGNLVVDKNGHLMIIQ